MGWLMDMINGAGFEYWWILLAEIVVACMAYAWMNGNRPSNFRYRPRLKPDTFERSVDRAVAAEREACAAHCDERAALERRKADSALARGDQPLWAGFANNADQNSMMAAELRRGDHHSDGRELKPPPAP